LSVWPSFVQRRRRRRKRKRRGGEGRGVYCSQPFTAETQVKHETWFSFLRFCLALSSLFVEGCS